ncbi:hypothetical protein [Mucilaginibacter sp. SJ]|uniref:hypothetical protein n=1 Tax=Mucilaginibacter sp. SJ TaxID=3029053 RepID=UPI0023A92AF4|nr:hypothetical protein [Mucilaginibacter sp. SJ]WEA00563.1 hypothetical protein MusilaSJ_24205 [Mucilaginibacter sp. SJ]
MKKSSIYILLISIVIITNLPVFNFFTQENYSYANTDGSFVYSEESVKGNSFQSCLINYGHFLCKHPEKDQGDNRLYRSFTIKPWRFREWFQMLFNERYRLPYKEKTNK